MDIITINQLELKAHIGVENWEQKIKQKIVLDINVGTNINTAAQSDKIDDTVDYSEIASAIDRCLATQRFFLLETLAAKIADLLFKQFKVSWLKLTVTKPNMAAHMPKAIAHARSVAVTIERNKP